MRLRQELLRRMRDDQDARKAIVPLLEKKGADEALKKRLREIDRNNTERMKEVMQRHGLPGKTLVGTDGANAAWLLLQHADRDPPFQKRRLSLLTEAVKNGEATGEQLAYLTDRVRVGENQKQVYATQLRWADGNYQPISIEDEANVDWRRKAVGLPPLADYLRLVEEARKPPSKGKP